LSLKVLFSSLLAVREYFNKPLEVVYIPSPATINSKENFFWAEGPRDVKNRTLGQPKLIDKIENHNLSRKIRKRISSFSSLNGFIFIDPTRKLMKLAESDLLYGPNDYHHFNLKGYRALYNIIQDHPIKK